MSDDRWDSPVFTAQAQQVSSPVTGQEWRYALVQSLVGPASVAGDQLFIGWSGAPLIIPGSGLPSAFARVLYPGQTAVFDKGVIDQNPIQLQPVTNWYGSFSIDTEPFSDGVVQTQPAAPGPGSTKRVGINTLVTATGAPSAVVVVAGGAAGTTMTMYYLNWSFVPTTPALGPPPAGLYSVGFQATSGGAQVITAVSLEVASVVGGLTSELQEIDAWSHPVIVGATGSGNGLQAIALSMPAGGAVLFTGIVMYTIA